MAGGKSAAWVDEDKTIEFVRSAKNQPFMLYFPFHDIHVPRVPNDMFAGKSGMSPRGGGNITNGLDDSVYRWRILNS